MRAFVLTLLSLSLSGSFIAIILLALKPVIRHRFSKAFQYYIWIVVLLRLVLPVSLDVNIVDGIFRSADVFVKRQVDVIESADMGVRDTINIGNFIPQGAEQKTVNSLKIISEPWYAIFWVWLAGMVVLLALKAVDYLRFVRNMRLTDKLVHDTQMLKVFDECRQELGIVTKLCLCTNVFAKSPMLLGVFQSELVIQEKDYTSTELRYIVRHELIHYKRLDLLYKWVAQIVLCVHWFNPIVHLMIREINHCCELSCDEAVIRHMDSNEKQGYGNVLIDTVSDGIYKKGVVLTTMCEDKRTLKERLTGIMKSGKKSKIVTAISVCFFMFIFSFAVMAGTFQDVRYLPPIIFETQKSDAINVVIKNRNTFNISESGYFYANDGDVINISIKENLTGNDAKLFIFSPSGKQTTFDVVSGNYTLKLNEGKWAWNCSGMFKSGNVEIVISNQKKKDSGSSISDGSIVKIRELIVGDIFEVNFDVYKLYQEVGVDGATPVYVKVGNETIELPLSSVTEVIGTEIQLEGSAKSARLDKTVGNYKVSSSLPLYKVSMGDGEITKLIALSDF